MVPRKVDYFGQHLSHDLTHHWPEDDWDDDDQLGLMGLANKRRRRRRSRRAAEDSGTLHYQLELNNETLHIELE